jgi:CRP-like cAMP-binding protein
MLYPENRLLAGLPSAIYQRLSQVLERVPLKKETVLLEVGERVAYVSFILSGLVSLLSTTKSGETVEGAMVGCEGAIGLPDQTNAGRAHSRAQVQIAGEALRISTPRLLAAYQRDRKLQESLSAYSRKLNAQFVQAVACHQFHSVEQRLARWLVMVRDRIDSDEVALTHENIARTLGVSRSNISAAAGSLQTEGLIRCGRGSIVILDHAGLAKASCECYHLLSQVADAPLPHRSGQILTESGIDR